MPAGFVGAQFVRDASFTSVAYVARAICGGGGGGAACGRGHGPTLLGWSVGQWACASVVLGRERVGEPVALGTAKGEFSVPNARRQASGVRLDCRTLIYDGDLGETHPVRLFPLRHNLDGGARSRSQKNVSAFQDAWAPCVRRARQHGCARRHLSKSRSLLAWRERRDRSEGGKREHVSRKGQAAKDAVPRGSSAALPHRSTLSFFFRFFPPVRKENS